MDKVNKNISEAQHEAFCDYADEVLTFAKDHDYAERLFQMVAYIYGHPNDDTHNEKLISLIREDTEGYIISLLDGLRNQTREHFEIALKNPVKDII